jgi:hypothetical protein
MGELKNCAVKTGNVDSFLVEEHSDPETALVHGKRIPQPRQLVDGDGLRFRTTGGIGTRPLCFKERAKFVSPSFLVIRIVLKSKLQHSLDSLLRFRPRQRGLEGGDGVEEPVRGRQRNLVDETLRGGNGAPIEGGNSAWNAQPCRGPERL